jgi:hypothetical protein
MTSEEEWDPTILDYSYNDDDEDYWYDAVEDMEIDHTPRFDQYGNYRHRYHVQTSQVAPSTDSSLLDTIEDSQLLDAIQGDLDMDNLDHPGHPDLDVILQDIANQAADPIHLNYAKLLMPSSMYTKCPYVHDLSANLLH